MEHNNITISAPQSKSSRALVFCAQTTKDVRCVAISHARTYISSNAILTLA